MLDGYKQYNNYRGDIFDIIYKELEIISQGISMVSSPGSNNSLRFLQSHLPTVTLQLHEENETLRLFLKEEIRF